MKPTIRDLLIAHIDGPAPYRAKYGYAQLVNSAVAGGLIRRDGCQNTKRTYITDKGREALAKMLADWADAIVRARFAQEALSLPDDRDDSAPP